MPEFPEVGEFTFRRASTDDVPAMLALHNACRERDRIDPYSVCYRLPNLTAESYRKEMKSSPPDATLIAEFEGKAVAHAFMEAWGFEERLYLWRVWVRPEVRGRGLGTSMHRWGEAMARQLHGGDDRPGIHLANATEHEQDAVALLAHEGYRIGFVSPELAFDAFGDLPDVVSIPSVELRPLSVEAIRPVARALAESNLVSAGAEGQRTLESLATRLDEWEPEWIERVREADPALSPIAWSGNEVVGVYLCGRKDDVGEIAQVAVRAAWRGRGIARALAMESLNRLRAAGCTTARLFTSMSPEDVEPTEGPYAMYRKFGFYPIARHLRFRKPF